MRILSQSTKGLRQHRAIRQEVSDRIFTPIQSLENEGILYVFLVFQTEEVGQKDGGDSQTQLCGVALKDFYRCGRSGNSSLVCYACVVYDLSGAAHRSGGCAHSGYSLFRIPCSRQFGNIHSPAILTPDAAVLLSRRENFYTVKQDACAQGSQFLEYMRHFALE